jgi:hypothetical protein
MATDRKLVRARPKRVEDLPEWAKCCDGRLAHHLKMPEVTLDIADHCHNPFPSFRSARRIDTGHWCSIELVDLDEGSYTNG